jgi:intein/homing endonuclease/glycosyltransferase involved in cell wall biosynthesis
MKIRWHAMVGTNHSWAQTQQAYIRAMMEIGGHDIYVKSTNGLEYFPNDLKHMLLPGYHNNLVKGPADFLTKDGQFITVEQKKPIAEIQDALRPYDLELAYTVFLQSPRRFFKESKARAIIWNYESSMIPPGWHLYTEAVDYILPSSQYSLDIFANNGVPKDKLVLVPHGVDTRVFNPDIPPFELKTNKKVKFLHVARPHARKHHDKIIKGYLDTFTGDDDVCLVLKTTLKAPDKDKLFEIDVRKILEEEYNKRSNPAEIEIVDTYVDHIGSLYTACDVHVIMSSSEGFCLLPGTPIDTKSGPKNIEDINVNDMVMTHTGKYQKVTKITSRHINEDIYNMRRLGSFEPISSTGNHPILISKNNQTAKWIGMEDVEKGDKVLIPKIKESFSNIKSINVTNHIEINNLFNDSGGIYLKGGRNNVRYDYNIVSDNVNCSQSTVKNIMESHYTCTNSPTYLKVQSEFKRLGWTKPEPTKMRNKITLDEETMEFFGLYLAEGCDDGRSNAFCIASHKDETYARDLCKTVGKKLFNCSYRERVENNTGTLWFNTKIGATLLSSLFGKSAKNKTIPKLLWGNKHINKLIGGYFYGDGCVNNGTYSFSTASFQLVHDLFQICLLNDIVLHIIFSNTGKYSHYTLNVARQHRDRFQKWISPSKYSKKNISIPKKVTFDTFVETEDYFLMPVTKKTSEHYDGMVYNLEVENGHSQLLNYIPFHYNVRLFF